MSDMHEPAGWKALLAMGAILGAEFMTVYLFVIITENKKKKEGKIR